MNVIHKLTFRHLKVNLKRTIITLIGIIVSVAMVTAVFTSAISFMKFMQRIDDNYEGHWTSTFSSVSIDDINTLKAREDVDSVAVQRSLGTVDASSDKNNLSAKTQTDLLESDSTMFKNFNILLSSGRFPSAKGEALVSESFIKDNKFDWKLGDTISLRSFDENSSVKEFKIVGITNTINPTTANHAVITSLDKNYQGKDLTAYVLNTKIDNGIWEVMESDAKSIGRSGDLKDEEYGFNYENFMYRGIFKNNDMLYSVGGFAAIILVIIIVASVFMIYNSFAVSLQQRSKYLGMLASVGATRKQKRSSVYFEGLILGAIGIPIGILAGLGGIAITFRCISGTVLNTMAIQVNEPLRISVNWVIIVGSAIVSALTILISAFIPAHKASKTTPIEALKQTNTVKVKKAKKLKSSKIARKIFGFEGDLALKNYKRNGKRSRIITSALALSLVLFLSVTYFSGSFSQLFNSQFGGAMHDIYISSQSSQSKKIDKALSSVSGIDAVITTATGGAKIENYSAVTTDSAKKYADKYDFSGILTIGLDSDKFDKYCKSIGVNPDECRKSGGAILANRTTLENVDNKSKVTVTPYEDLAGKTIKVTDEKDEKKTPVSLKIIATTDKKPEGDTEYLPQAMVVMDVESYAKTFADSQIMYAIDAEDHKGVFEKLDEYMTDNGIENSSYDATEQLSAMKSIMVVVNVFTYGFITLITLISVANIVNTVFTSMDERRREFAMIKSVGLTPKSFKKMIYLENIYYGIRALLWGLPLSVGLSYLMYKFMAGEYDFGFKINGWYYLIAIVAVFLIIGVALIYSTGRIKHDNIIETLKNDDV